MQRRRAHSSHDGDSHPTDSLITATFSSQEEEVEEEGSAPSTNDLLNAELERLRDALAAKDDAFKAVQTKLMWAMHKRPGQHTGQVR